MNDNQRNFSAVILAGGVGSRLKNSQPKCLLKINDEFFIERQINFLLDAGITDITVVVGHKHYLIMEVLSDLYPNTPIKFVYNTRFNSTNTSKSLLLALKSLQNNKSVIWMNADVITEVNEFIPLLEVFGTTLRTTLLVNTERVSDEEIKYVTGALHGNILQLSKQVAHDMAEGEAIGINLMAAFDVPEFISQLERVDDQDYFEKGLENSNILMYPLQTSGKCIEVDFQSDYDLAKSSI